MEKARKAFRQKWKREFSAGGVVWRKSKNRREVLLIQPNRDRKCWVFPKGWIDKDETTEEAAIREVREEGGVNAKIESDLGEVKYVFQWEGERILKTVHYFLMKYVSGDPADHDFEVKESRWFLWEEAKKNLSYRTDREIFGRAEALKK